MSKLMQAQCGCIILSDYDKTDVSNMIQARVVRDCCTGSYTLTERHIQTNENNPVLLTPDEEQEIWDELHNILVDGYRMRELRSILGI